MSAVPAWKRLGLKLKGPSTDRSPISIGSTPSAPPAARPRPDYPQHTSSYNSRGGQDGGYDNGTPFNKRKQQFSSPYPSSDNKRTRRDDSDFNASKKVSFSQDTKKAAPKKPKKKKKNRKPQQPKDPYDFALVLEYLRTWHKTRDSWKFNKNHQTLMIKHIYTSNAIPSSDIDIFYQYIIDIKGASRKRLIEEAKEIIKKDMEFGLKGFPQGTKADKQKDYEEILAELLKKKAAIKDGAAVNGNGKRSFDEAEFVTRKLDKDVQQRVVKRMRAEVIAEELESSDSSESTDVSTAVSTSVSTPRIVVPVTNGPAASVDGDKDAPKAKKVRRRKLRNGGADSSSSESDSDSDSSDSDSDSDTPATACAADSSSSSSSESDSDEEMANGNNVPNDEASSSSSSSSDSGSDSGDEGVAVADGDDSSSDGDSESSDDDDDE